MSTPTADEALAILARLQRAGWSIDLMGQPGDPGLWTCRARHRHRPDAVVWSNGLFVDMLVNLEQTILEPG